MPWTCHISLSASIVLPRSIGPPLVALALDCISPGNWCKHMGDASGPRVPRGRVAPSMSCCPWEKSPKLDFVLLLAERSQASAQQEGPPCLPERSERVTIGGTSQTLASTTVILSAAKDLAAPRARPYASLRACPRAQRRGDHRRHQPDPCLHPCHPERGEGSRCPSSQTFRCAQGDNRGQQTDPSLRVTLLGHLG